MQNATERLNIQAKRIRRYQLAKKYVKLIEN